MLARAEAVQTAKREAELAQALQEEQLAKRALREAEERQEQAQRDVESARAKLVAPTHRRAEDLQRCAGDLARSQQGYEAATKSREAAIEAFGACELKTRAARLAWAEARAREQALSTKLSAEERAQRKKEEKTD